MYGLTGVNEESESVPKATRLVVKSDTADRRYTRQENRVSGIKRKDEWRIIPLCWPKILQTPRRVLQQYTIVSRTASKPMPETLMRATSRTLRIPSLIGMPMSCQQLIGPILSPKRITIQR